MTSWRSSSVAYGAPTKRAPSDRLTMLAIDVSVLHRHDRGVASVHQLERPRGVGIGGDVADQQARHCQDEHDRRNRRGRGDGRHRQQLALLVLPMHPGQAPDDQQQGAGDGAQHPGGHPTRARFAEPSSEPGGERRTGPACPAHEPGAEGAERVADTDSDGADRRLNHPPPRHQRRHEREPPEHCGDDDARCGGTTEHGLTDGTHGAVMTFG